ncbi:hypothetical protein EFP49_02205 [Lactobacillus johnsonii]|uniref:ImmA/IrrE family metallo-endopeptidase n=1 Tax=Lactobacillus johnsonii TaxID=33959 RepID=UPI0021A445BD|nr:hypothetical protein [Lactobacillus johnsonii]MCT3341634.1 hypothetical protein [Lactobacillus johnsonii]
MTEIITKTKSEFEYKPIPHNLYHQYQCLAIRVITRIAHKYHIAPNKINYNHILNYFKYNFPYSHLRLLVPNDEILDLPNISDNESIIKRFNHKAYQHGLNIKADIVENVDESVLEAISGFTIFSESDPFINICYSQQLVWPRIVFTLLHEYGHIYCYKIIPTYADRYIYVQRNKDNEDFKREYDQFEAEASTFASLLYVSDCSLGDNLLKKSFKQLQAIYSMSTPAMFNRLRNYFEHNCKTTRAEASIFSTYFKNNYIDEIKMIRKEIICKRPKLIQDYFTF